MYKLESLREKIKGPIFSIITPFQPNDESIDFDALEKYIRYMYLSGAKIFFVMGYNSRFSELSWEEIMGLNAFVTSLVKEIDAENLVIVADPLHCPTSVSIQFAQHAQSIGADLISIICREKFYSEDQIYSHYAAVAESTGIGILVHEMPFASGYGGPPINWPISLLDKIANVPNVIAIKEDAKNDDYSRQVINVAKDRAAIIMSGSGQRQWLQFADIGCQAWLNGIGAFEPRLETLFWKHYLLGNLEVCEEFILKIGDPFFELIVKKYSWHLSIKAILESKGFMSRHERLPLKALEPERCKEVIDIFNQLPVKEVVEKYSVAEES